MIRRCSEAEVLAGFPEILDAVERGEHVEIMRGGRTVAALVPAEAFRRSKARGGDFARAFRAWRESVDEGDLAPDPFGGLRNGSDQGR